VRIVRPRPPSTPPQDAARDITLDRLPETAEPVQVLSFDGFDVGGQQGSVREPHRHDYHELLWTRSGAGHHLLDGQPIDVLPQTVTVIGRGQVHVFERARNVTGAVIRFGPELIYGGPAQRALPAWLLGGTGGRTVPVPDGDVDHLEAIIATLGAESVRPPDTRSPDLQRHLLSVVLLWVERWYDAARTERRDPDDADIQLYRRFAQALERDFARHHEASHYADALAVPPAALARALTHVTGRPTKELITDRVMLEAARLLRFTELSIGEVAYQTGFPDQLYFSRAFKRHHGESPMAYRNRAHGRG
jgi:AraC family transcriptional regulator, transcriptional activator of pobA